ncbi:hypothetical protein FOIG_16532 [Fusarium odoratissimum NRRL 54006]|uniref:Uncharacterized protein n=1 Tax=Fusarium odoratissimum (strain NRRL 54006) TaxID=1089451 RepID=X0JZD2_FUSO5|nr:uncharacterized protein FOIG_16532 [Fusarium odoratissimum NRRL 54006]EXL90214.1 hypothetical protein FOIG_16532 [Fusarium odoratissimum NRRL 54006]
MYEYAKGVTAWIPDWLHKGWRPSAGGWAKDKDLNTIGCKDD